MSSKNQPPFEAISSDSRSLETLRNLGPKSISWLRDAGIQTEADLRSIGPVIAFQIIRRQQQAVSRNLLWALYGAIHEVDWRDISAETKESLASQLEE